MKHFTLGLDIGITSVSYTHLDVYKRQQLQGDINDLQMIRQQNNISVVADLRQLGEGSSEIQLEVQNIPSRVEVFIESGNVNVVLKKKVTRTYTLGYDFVNQSQMDATYDLGEPQFDSDTVNVLSLIHI